jgi:hypothetical protein
MRKLPLVTSSRSHRFRRAKSSAFETMQVVELGAANWSSLSFPKPSAPYGSEGAPESSWLARQRWNLKNVPALDRAHITADRRGRVGAAASARDRAFWRVMKGARWLVLGGVVALVVLSALVVLNAASSSSRPQQDLGVVHTRLGDASVRCGGTSRARCGDSSSAVFSKCSEALTTYLRVTPSTDAAYLVRTTQARMRALLGRPPSGNRWVEWSCGHRSAP